MAAVLFASLRRVAMRLLSRVIFAGPSHASWGRWPEGAAGAAGAAAAGAGAGAAAGDAPPCSSASRTSPLVMRPSLPVPRMRRASRLFSSISFCAAGRISAGAPGAGAAAAGAGAAAGAAAGAGAGCGAGFASGAAAAGAETLPLAPAVIRPSRAPTSTSVPSGAEISSSRPDSCALISRVTLSVSSSRSGSSLVTESPTFLYHWPTVASVTDSPSAGTRISTVILTSLFRFDTERVVQQCVLFLDVLFQQAGCRRCGFLAPGVARALHLLHFYIRKNAFQMRLHKCPGTHVFRLLL